VKVLQKATLQTVLSGAMVDARVWVSHVESNPTGAPSAGAAPSAAAGHIALQLLHTFNEFASQDT
jgi:hypothetical protein